MNPGESKVWRALKGTCLLGMSFATEAWAQAGHPAPASPLSAGSLLQVLFGLLVVLALMAGAAWLIKRLNPARAGSSGDIRIVGGVSVGTRERVIVVEVADQWIVVGVAPGNVNALATMPRRDASSSDSDVTGTTRARNFSLSLRDLINQRNVRQ